MVRDINQIVIDAILALNSKNAYECVHQATIRDSESDCDFFGEQTRKFSHFPEVFFES